MTPLSWLAAIVLFLQLPIPLYWFVVHPGVRFWRLHERAAYISGLLLAWPPVTACLFWFHDKLFREDSAPLYQIVAGLALIVLEGWIFYKVHRDLGTARLVGKTELLGKGEIADQGIYGRLRHPRYVGSFLAIVGACLVAGTYRLWTVAAMWAVLTRAAIYFEERELRARFGKPYVEYCERVPRFLPFA